ncbi:MAG TPA: response regulator, partial [bacterium]|nr:response regulator [bacterium]
MGDDARLTTKPMPSKTARPYVLIVDYDPVHSRIALSNLQEKFPDVEFALVRNGQDAVSMMQSRIPDLTITDLQMPGLNGFALLRKIRADEYTREVPVMVLGGVRDMESVRLAVSLGADDFIAKPVDFHVLSKRINQLMAKKKLGLSLRENHRAYKRREVQLPVEVHLMVVAVGADRFTVLMPGEVVNSASSLFNISRLCRALRVPVVNEPVGCLLGECRSVKGGYLVDLLLQKLPQGYPESAGRVHDVAGYASQVLGNPRQPVYVGLQCTSLDVSGGGIRIESPWPFPSSAGLRISLRKLLGGLGIRAEDVHVTCIVRHAPKKQHPFHCGL